MRLIGTLEDERQGLTFSLFLKKKGILHQLDIHPNTDWGSPQYGSTRCDIWIQDEDQVPDALKWLHFFLEHPQDPVFQSGDTIAWPHLKAASPTSPGINSTPTQVTTGWDKQPMGWITRLLLITCCGLFFLSQFTLPSTSVPARYAGLILFTSPVEKHLLFDYPKFYQLIDQFIRLYGYEGLEKTQDLPPEGSQLLQKINKTPFWPGIYALLLKSGFKGVEKGFTQYPLFEKIQQGQVWRLFTPCLLHGDLFHLFFNMIWLIVLGKQIEQRLSAGRYILFILSIGIISNIAQYLSGGSNFIGFSGILCGMLAFIWVRQKRAAWEGYQLDRLTLVFMLMFILGMAALQLLSFLLAKSLDIGFSIGLANTAHLMGGIIGYFFGRLNFFSWRHA